MNIQNPPLFEAPLAHEVGVHSNACTCRQCRSKGAFEWESHYNLMQQEWEVMPSGGFIQVAVERPGGGRIRDKRDPAPADIVYVQGFSRRIPLHRLAAAAWQALVNEARASGIQAPLLLPVSGYRSWAEQNVLWQRALRNYGSPDEARKYVAPPGSSAHQSGRAIDFYLGGSVSKATSKKNIDYLRTLPAYQWLVANAQRFGFYPYPVEPWHWEYNPPATGVRPQSYPQPPQKPVLRRGSRGPAVQELQSRLNGWLTTEDARTGLRLLVTDGIFGPRTEAAVRAFQRARQLRGDGVVGPQTWGQLLAVRPQPGPPAPAGVPQLIKSEGQPPQSTLYVNIPLGSEGAARPMTGIYIPENYHPQPGVDLILFLHGFKAGTDRRRPDPGWTIDQYWRLPCRAFREGVHASHKSVILVSPTLGQFSEPGMLTAPGGFDRYIDQVMAALATYGPYMSRRPAVGNIILAAHSGGGSPMALIALANQRYTSLIRECWAFDSMYGGSSVWADWAAKNPQARLYNYYRQTRDKNGRPNGTWPASDALERRNLPNVITTALQPKIIAHDQVPIQYWRTRIDGASFLIDK